MPGKVDMGIRANPGVYNLMRTEKFLEEFNRVQDSEVQKAVTLKYVLDSTFRTSLKMILTGPLKVQALTTAILSLPFLDIELVQEIIDRNKWCTSNYICVSIP